MFTRGVGCCRGINFGGTCHYAMVGVYSARIEEEKARDNVADEGFAESYQGSHVFL